MPDLIINQSQFYENENCRAAIKEIEKRYKYTDETEYFGTLVNFSTAKKEPYQRWVRYREGYSTALVNELIRRSGIDPQQHFIADPMVGSGSTIISAKKSGYDAFGVDVNPFCQLIVNTKLLSPAPDDIHIVQEFLSGLPTVYRKTRAIKPPLSEYFPEDNLVNLLELRKKIDSMNEQTAKHILLAAWFFILESCSNRKKDGNGLATRPAPVQDVVSHFRDVVNDIIADYLSCPLGSESFSTVYTGTACEFSKYSQVFSERVKKKLGAIIFSPPYANAFDYYESYKMELLFGQLYDPSDYQIHKKQQIRNYRICYGRELHCDYSVVEYLCDAINQAIPVKEKQTGKRDSRTRLMPNMLRGYFTDMGKVLSELYQALDHSGYCYIVVDQSAYVGVIVPTDVILANIAESIGFEVENIIICRKAATSVQQRKAYPYLVSTLRESIVCLQKK